MALPNSDNLKTMDYVWSGAPFVEMPAKAAIDTKTMDYVWRGAPFVRNEYVAAGGAKFPTPHLWWSEA